MFQDWTSILNCIYTDPKTGNQAPTLQCLPVVFHNAVNGGLLFAGAVALFLIIWGGIRFITSGGDPKQVAGAQKIITYALIGLIVVLLSFAIVLFISYLTQTPCITDPAKFVTGC